MLLPFSSAGLSQKKANSLYLKKTGDTGNGLYTFNASSSTIQAIIASGFINTALLRDRFDRPDTVSSLGTADQGGTWVVTAGGTFIISFDTAYYDTDAIDAQATLDAGSANVTAQVQCLTDANDGIVIRFSDTNNFWLALNSSGTTYLYKKVAGSYTLINSATGSLPGDILTLTGNGNAITLWRNSIQILSTSDSFNNTATKCGLRSATQGTQWDNFIVVAFKDISQVTGNIQEWQDQGGDVLAFISPLGDLSIRQSILTTYGGNVGLGTAVPAYTLDIHGVTTGGSSTLIAARVDAGSLNVEFRNTNGTSNKTQFVLGGGAPGGTYGRTYSIGIDPGAAGAVNFFLSDNANNFIPLFVDASDNVAVASAANLAFGGATLNAAFTTQPKAAGTIASIIQGFTSQSADLTQWQKSDGTIYAKVDANGKIITLASSTARAGFNLPSGTAPTSPVDGDIWYDGTNLKVRLNGVTKTVTAT